MSYPYNCNPCYSACAPSYEPCNDPCLVGAPGLPGSNGRPGTDGVQGVKGPRGVNVSGLAFGTAISKTPITVLDNTDVTFTNTLQPRAGFSTYPTAPPISRVFTATITGVYDFYFYVSGVAVAAPGGLRQPNPLIFGLSVNSSIPASETLFRGDEIEQPLVVPIPVTIINGSGLIALNAGDTVSLRNMTGSAVLLTSESINIPNTTTASNAVLKLRLIDRV